MEEVPLSIELEIKSKQVLETAVLDIQDMSHERYALLRKNFFGASDSSILCGVNLYKTMDQLIKEKNTKYLTAEEKAVSEKPIVKKGYDLEPFILHKAQDVLETHVYKPRDMFKFKNVDGLSVNYDGVIIKDVNTLIPVEAKLVSRFGEKYYNKGITFDKDFVPEPITVVGETLSKHIKQQALKCGIPAYYYTQVQQEIAGLDAPYGYLIAWFDESWSYKIYTIPRDDYVIDKIYIICSDKIAQIKRDTI